MGTSTLSASGGTWIGKNIDVAHSGEASLRSVYYENNSYARAAVLQFTIPSSIKYKRFTKATLTFYTTGNGQYTPQTGVGVKAAPYLAGNVLSTLTWDNAASLGQVGEIQIYENHTYSTSSFPRWRSIEILDIFSGNIYNDQYFTVFLYAIPGSGLTTNDYAVIGGPSSSYPPTLTLTYEDVTQLPPTPTYPNGSYINENTDILFSWAWNSSTPAVQASVQLEYKLKTAGSYTVVNLTQSAHTYTLAGGLPQGTYQWRIKGTNDAGETSGYSDVVEFNVIGKPAVPVINTPANRTLTEITWNTTDQNAFDITLTDANGKELINESVASSVSSYKPNMFLKGTYTVGIRTRNSTGRSSDWSYKVFSITASGPAKPTMRLLQDDVRAFITVLNPGDMSYAVVRKDMNDNEEVLGFITQGVPFIDKTFGFGITYRYVVRAFSTGGYTDSDPEYICYNKTAIVLETDSDEIILDRSEEKFLPYEEDVSGDMAVFNCVGRELPVVEHGETESRAFRSRLYIRDDQKERLAEMAKQNSVFYRDYSGRAFPVAINSPVNFSRYFNEGYMADLQFIRIAKTEVIINV